MPWIGLAGNQIEKFLPLFSWHISTSQKHCAVWFSSAASSHKRPGLREGLHAKGKTEVCRKLVGGLLPASKDLLYPDEEAPRNPPVSNWEQNNVVHVKVSSSVMVNNMCFGVREIRVRILKLLFTSWVNLGTLLNLCESQFSLSSINLENNGTCLLGVW